MRSASFDLTFLVASQPLTTSKFLNKQYLSCLFLEICETMWFNLLYFDKIFAGHAQALARNQKNEVSFVIHNLPVIAKMAAVAKVNLELPSFPRILTCSWHIFKNSESTNPFHEKFVDWRFGVSSYFSRIYSESKQTQWVDQWYQICTF